MDSALELDEIHILFHRILGRLTTVRTAIWELEQSKGDTQVALKMASQESEALVSEIELLKKQVYPLLNSK